MNDDHPFVVENGITRLSRLKDGRIMCSLCFEYTPREALYVDPKGQRWDICTTCGAKEES